MKIAGDFLLPTISRNVTRELRTNPMSTLLAGLSPGCSPAEAAVCVHSTWLGRRARTPGGGDLMQLVFVERDRFVQRWLAAQASALDVQVLCAADDYEALEILALVRPDAVLMDVGSGAQPGSARWRHLCRLLNARFIPLLLYASSRRLTTYAERLGRRWGGALVSPFTLTSAIQTVERVKARRRAAEARQVAVASPFVGSPRCTKRPAALYSQNQA